MPLSFAQQRLWFLYQLEGPSPTYNLAFPFRFEGLLDIAALERACALIVARQDSLRTRFQEANDQAIQIIEPFSALNLAFADLSLLDSDTADVFARDLMEREAALPFNLETGPVYRVTLVRFSPTRHLLLFSQHHIVSDGWSVGVITNELGMAYNTLCGQSLPSEHVIPLPELPIQYADYAVWQRNWLQGRFLSASLSIGPNSWRTFRLRWTCRPRARALRS